MIINSIDDNLIYKILYEDSPQLYRTINTDGIIIKCNKAYARSLGYSMKQIIGGSIFGHVTKESMDAMRESFQRWKRTGHVKNREVTFQRKNGSTFTALVSANNIYDKKGKLIGSNTVITDITEIRIAKRQIEDSEVRIKKQYDELKKAHELLLNTEKKYQNLYEKTPVLLRTITIKGILTDCNEAYAKALGYPKKEAIGMSIYDHTAKRSIKDMKDNLEEWKKTHQISATEIWCKRKDGSTFPTLLSGTSLYDEQGKLIGRTLALTDLTEILEARTKLQESQIHLQEQYQELKKLDALKNHFLAMITHELKTPLVPIKSYIEIMLSEKFGPLNNTQKERLAIVQSSTDYLLKLVGDILDAQKIELGQLKMVLEVYDLTEVVNRATQKFSEQAERYGVNINTSLQSKLFCLCDPVRIEQVITNLLANAIKFSPKGKGQILVSLYKEKDYAKIIVKDNGIGIIKDNLKKIFVKFYQIDATSTREYGGTGLGLSVSKGLIENHGGEIWAESEGKNKGTEIHIRLPLK